MTPRGAVIPDFLRKRGRRSRHPLLVAQLARQSEVTVRVAIPEDADGIARVLIESAELHARLDPERYSVPATETISARYRGGQQQPPEIGRPTIVLVAEAAGAIVGVIDARLDCSPDPMHREIVYCSVVEIAVNESHRNQGIGRKLMLAIEAWGRRQGAEFALLEYHAANSSAAEFYQNRMGYRTAAITAIKRLQGSPARCGRVSNGPTLWDGKGSGSV